MNNKLLICSINHARRLISAAGFSLVHLLLAMAAQAQITIQDGSPLTITCTTGNSLSQPFAATDGVGVVTINPRLVIV